jgi:predicted nicotinamide N-methyase
MPGYQTRQQRITIAGADDLLIRSLSDNQQFADPLGEAAELGISSAAWPLFGMVWPSGVELAVRLAARRVRPEERILEIGCGLALASLVGHRAGADVSASDCHPLAAAFLLENIRLNELAPLKYRHGDWAEPPFKRGAGDARRRRIVRGRFDLIIGSDVLYERDDRAVLAGFIARHAMPVADVWIVDPDRGNRAAFNRRMDSLGFELHESRLDRPLSDSGAAYKGRLLRYDRAA